MYKIVLSSFFELLELIPLRTFRESSTYLFLSLCINLCIYIVSLYYVILSLSLLSFEIQHTLGKYENKNVQPMWPHCRSRNKTLPVPPDTLIMPFPITVPSLPTPRVNHSFDFYVDHFLAWFTLIHAFEILWFSFIWSLVLDFFCCSCCLWNLHKWC